MSVGNFPVKVLFLVQTLSNDLFHPNPKFFFIGIVTIITSCAFDAVTRNNFFRERPNSPGLLAQAARLHFARQSFSDYSTGSLQAE